MPGIERGGGGWVHHQVRQALSLFETNRWLVEPYTLQLLRWVLAHTTAECTGTRHTTHTTTQNAHAHAHTATHCTSLAALASHCAAVAASGEPVGGSVDLEYAPHVFVAPIPSNTIRPFTATNLVPHACAAMGVRVVCGVRVRCAVCAQ